MPYDSTLPVDHSPVVAAELRGQFQGLQDNIDLCATSAQLEDSVQHDTAAPPQAVDLLNMTVSNPPTQAQIQTIADKIDEILAAIKRP